MDENKRRKLIVLQTAIRKARETILEDNAKEWFSGFSDKPWYTAAVEGYVSITAQVGKLLSDWKRDTLATMRGGLYQPESDDQRKDVKKAGKQYRTEEYLDERYDRVVVPDVRDELTELQDAYQRKLEELYEAVVVGGVVPTALKALSDAEGLPFHFNQPNPLVRDLLQTKKIHWARQVAATTENYIKQNLVDGYEQGLSTADVAASIKQSVGFHIVRAEKVARTETMGACSMADYARSSANPDVVGHRWRSHDGGRTRPTHRAANGQFRAKGKPFEVGGAKLLHPGDNSLGAPAKEIVNCRCWLEPVFQDDPITPDETHAINRYVSSDAYTLNEKLRSRETLNASEAKLVYNLDSALARLPIHKGHVLRDLVFINSKALNNFVAEHLAHMKAKKPIEYSSYLSTTLDKEGYMENPNVQLHILSKRGRDIRSYYSGENEILFERNSAFMVLNAKMIDGVLHFYLEG